MSDNSTTLRSPWAAYGPAILVGVGVLLALVVLFLSARKPAESARAANTVVDQSLKRRDEQTMKVEEVRKRTGGNWSKATEEEKKHLNDLSHGHGEQFLKMKPR